MHNKSHAGENVENFPLEIDNDTRIHLLILCWKAKLILRQVKKVKGIQTEKEKCVIYMSMYVVNQKEDYCIQGQYININLISIY